MSHGFELTREQKLPELNSAAKLYRHRKTGAQLLSIENEDENKVFGVNFCTPPRDSTGLTHILEHSVLCGSRKYPVKEPFVELIKGSLNTFLNAMTYPDKTCYPVASQNLRDFYNLIDVYLDAVFYPRITLHTFQQEGWHYELEEIEAPLTYKGVVYNEMKGNYSSPDNVLMTLSQESLFPDNIYGVDAGGDPRRIPDLTYDELKSFHRRYYHPSNARLFFYGDDDPDERLRRLDECLAAFEPIEVDPKITLQPRFSAPKRLHQTFVAGEAAGDAKQGMVTINWMLDEFVDVETTLALDILERILIGTRASPLRKALIDSGLGEDITPGGLNGDLRQWAFSTGLKGIDPADSDKIEALVLDTLRTLTKTGIDRLTVDAALNTEEFILRENNTGSFPRGIAVMLRSLQGWLYDRDPLAPLRFAAPLEAIKSKVGAGERYFEDLIARLFLANTHRTTVLLRPDPAQAAREEADERARLDKARAAMSRADLQAVIEATRTLKRLQETPDPPEALATIPSLHLGDLPREIRRIPLEVARLRDTRILYHELATNGVLYLDVGFDLHGLPADLLPYVPLFGHALLETGVGEQDFVSLSQRIGRTTGGIRPAVWSSAVAGTPECAAWLFLRAKAMPARADELMAILRDVVLTARLDDRERIRQLVLEDKTSQEAGLVPGGSSFVDTRLRSGFHEADWVSEQTEGISYLFFLRELALKVETDWPAVERALERIRATLVNRAGMLCNVTTDAASFAAFEGKLGGFLDALPTTPVAPQRWQTAARPRAEGLTIPATVNFVGKGANLRSLGYEPTGAADVIGIYLGTTWLWDKVRVQGGAYGGFCGLDWTSGAFTYLSYRDPNLLATLDVYDKTAGFLKAAALSDSELTRSIIGTIGKHDAYQLPDAKGMTSMLRYLTGITDEVRQRKREQILSTSAADFRAFADVLAQVAERGQVVVLGSEQAIAAANAERAGWFTVAKVL